MIDVATGKHALAYKRQTATGWADADVWVKVDGTYHQLVPPNCIILYDSMDIEGVVADGDNGSLNLVGKFPRLGKDTVSFEGNETHDGTSHGKATHAFKAASNTKDCYDGFSVGDTCYYYSGSTHNHTTPEHTHGGSGSNIPSHKNLVPSMFGDIIGSDAVFLLDNDITEQTWFDIVNYAKQLMFAADNNEYTASGHAHNIANLNSSETSVNNKSGGSWTSRTSANKHYHTLNHKMASYTPTPYVKSYKTYKTNRKAYFDMLPSGTVVLCVTDYIPQGWQRYTPNVSGVKLGDNYDYSGSDTHKHTSQSLTSSALVQTSTIRWRQSDYHDLYSLKAHTHTYTEVHTDAVDITPPSVNLYAIIKE